MVLSAGFLPQASFLVSADCDEKVRGISKCPRSAETNSNHSAFLEFSSALRGFAE
ncbi:MAG: hypothetical protein ACR2RE_22575 [Geminicoccaceae bacterium]